MNWRVIFARSMPVFARIVGCYWTAVIYEISDTGFLRLRLDVGYVANTKAGITWSLNGALFKTMRGLASATRRARRAYDNPLVRASVYASHVA